MNKLQGKDRRRVKTSIKAAEYQEKKFGLTEAEKARLEDLRNSLKEKR